MVEKSTSVERSGDHPPIRVMVVDDHLVVRRGFAMFLKAFPDLEMIGEASNGLEATRLYSALNPDVILMDMVMPEMDGITATRLIRSQSPHVQVIALTSYNDNKELVQSALEAGAIGYLFKNVSVDDLVQAIHAAYQGITTLSPEVTRMLIQAKTQRAPDDFKLSDREREVLQLLVTGLSNREIAERLFISASTTKFHVSSILGKLGATSRIEAVTIAHQHKLVN